MPPAASDPEFVITRVFDAPPDVVFQAWTVPAQFVCWFGTHDTETTGCEIDPRPGGVIRFCHEFLGGMKLWVKAVFLEVEPPRRLVFEGGFVDAEGKPGPHPMVADWPLDALIETSVTLEPTPGGTRVTVRQRVKPEAAAALESVAHERRLARDGWTEVMDRLASFLDSDAGRRTTWQS